MCCRMPARAGCDWSRFLLRTSPITSIGLRVLNFARACVCVFGLDYCAFFAQTEAKTKKARHLFVLFWVWQFVFALLLSYCSGIFVCCFLYTSPPILTSHTCSSLRHMVLNCRDRREGGAIGSRRRAKRSRRRGQEDRVPGDDPVRLRARRPRFRHLR